MDSELPRSSRYDRRWAEEHSLGENVLYMAETLSEVLPFAPGMRVLDLGCGHAISSIFLAREFGVQVWAVDRGVDPTDNFTRIAAHGCADLVFPLRAEARALPLPRGYFDAVVAFDSYLYYGTDDRFLPYLAQHLRSGGYLGVVDMCAAREFPSLEDVPARWRGMWQAGDWYLVHSLDWWRHHWTKTGLVSVEVAERSPASDRLRREMFEQFRDDPEEHEVLAFLDSDLGREYETCRLLARRTERPISWEDEDGEVPY